MRDGNDSGSRGKATARESLRRCAKAPQYSSVINWSACSGFPRKRCARGSTTSLRQYCALTETPQLPIQQPSLRLRHERNSCPPFHRHLKYPRLRERLGSYETHGCQSQKRPCLCHATRSLNRNVHEGWQAEKAVPIVLLPQLIFGYHGCDKGILRLVLDGGELKPSVNAYDWLGHGIYFWESSPNRALRWAEEMSDIPGSAIVTPAVIGAVINLGNCLDLSDPESASLVAFPYKDFLEECQLSGIEPPRNKGAESKARFLDCAVMNHLHKLREEAGMAPFNSVRGFFNEGAPVYPTAGLRKLDHVQVCLRNPACITGFFRPNAR